MSSPEAAMRLNEGWLTQMGLPLETLARPGTSVVGIEDRRDSGYAVCYRLGEHRAVACDPALVDALAPLVDTATTRSDDELCDFGASLGWPFSAQAVQKTLQAPLEPSDRLQTDTRLADYSVHYVDWSRDGDLALMSKLLEVSSADDLDEAEVELDNLDKVAVAVLDPAGDIAAYAGMRPWIFGAFGDVGVITRSDQRGLGLGQAVVSALITEVMPSDWEPLYRHDSVNTGSDRLSEALGFVVANDLVAIGPIDPY